MVGFYGSTTSVYTWLGQRGFGNGLCAALHSGAREATSLRVQDLYLLYLAAYVFSVSPNDIPSTLPLPAEYLHMQ